MNALIHAHLPELERLCRRLGVLRLDLFGSPARPDFAAARSAIDFLVRPAPMPPPRYADAYFQLKEDLVTEASLVNPYRRARIESERKRL